MRSIWQLRVHNKDLLKVLMTNPFGQNAHRKVFQKASQFLLPLPNVQLSPQINVLHTSKIQCRLLNYLNFSSPTTTRCLSRRDFPTYHVNLYNSVPLVPGSIHLDYLGEPTDVTCTKAHALSEEAPTLNTPGLTIFPPCTEDPILSPVLFGPKLGAEEGQLTAPLILGPSAFLLVS